MGQWQFTIRGVDKFFKKEFSLAKSEQQLAENLKSLLCSEHAGMWNMLYITFPFYIPVEKKRDIYVMPGIGMLPKRMEHVKLNFTNKGSLSALAWHCHHHT
jgi:hypothetical protein